MKLNEHASKEDLRFWRFAERNGCRNHSKCHQLGLKACENMPKHRRRNAYFFAYNSEILRCLKEAGVSYSEHVSAAKENRPERQQKRKPKQEAKPVVRKPNQPSVFDDGDFLAAADKLRGQSIA